MIISDEYCLREQVTISCDITKSFIMTNPKPLRLTPAVLLIPSAHKSGSDYKTRIYAIMCIR